MVLSCLVTAFVLDAHVAAWAVQWKRPLLDEIVGMLNPVGSGVTLLLACMALAGCGRALRWSRLEGAAWLGTLAFVCAGLLEFTLKHLVSRPRPDSGLPGLSLLGPAFVPDVDSFPSGHATSVFAVATAFAPFYPRLRPLLYVLAGVVAVGRVYLARHYLSDIVAGAAIGIVIAALLQHHPRARSRWTRPEPATAPSR
jgi:membrane-associated phospholipid phosphatase